MLLLVGRRARAQWRLLVAVVLLVAVAAGFVGLCAQLAGPTRDRAFHAAVMRTDPADVAVTAYLVDVASPDLEVAREQAGSVVRDVLAPLPTSVTSVATSRMRGLGEHGDLAYLATDDDLPARAELVTGAWPGSRRDAVVPEEMARQLDVVVGDRVDLGGEIGLGGVDSEASVVVSGVYRPRSRAGWTGDPLGGAGYDPAYSDGSVTAPAYGPVVVGEATFRATGSTVTGARVTAVPDLADAVDDDLDRAVAALDDASTLLAARVDDRARITRVGSDLPATLDRVHAQQDSTRGTLLQVLLLGAALTLAAALLAGWLLAEVRRDERTLLVALGLGRRQQLGLAVLDALLVAGAATALAVPAAAVVHHRLTGLRDLRAAGLAEPVTLSTGVVVAVAGAALLLSSALVATALDRGTTPAASTRWTAVRGGLDLVLLAVAVVCWWQVRAPSAGSRADAALTLAPVLGFAAAVVLAVRLVPLLLAGAARLAVRSRGLVLPLAVQQASRRPHLLPSMVLVTGAVAAVVLGLALRTTWVASQEDQAALRTGTDLVLALDVPAGPEVAATVADATDGATVSPVIDRPLVLGRFVGEPGSPPLLVAVDARRAGALLQGRAGDTGWAQVGELLTPGPALEGPEPVDGARLELRGRVPGGLRLLATPTIVTQDPTGLRSAVTAAAVPLDGRGHPLRWRVPPAAGSAVVAVRLEIEPEPGTELPATTAPVAVRIRVPGAGAAGSWEVAPRGRDTPVRSASVAIEATSGGATLTIDASVDATYLAYDDADVLATAFAPPEAVPVVVSADLVSTVGAQVGAELSAVVGETTLPLRVVAVVPSVPSAPGRVAVLADADTLTRALIGAGDLRPVVDGYWVADPDPATEATLRAADLGHVTTRAEVAAQLTRGPLRVVVPTALLVLPAAAAVMLLAGLALLLVGDRQRRRAELAHLRAIGLTRQDLTRLLVAEQAVLLLPLVALGVAVGAGVVLALGPHLVRSDVGGVPVPPVVVTWPWVAEALAVGALLVGSLLVVTVATLRQVRAGGPR